MRHLLLSCLLLLSSISAATAQQSEQNGQLSQPVIPGLRYYYPPTRVVPRTEQVDVCIYGGTSGGVVAAIQASRMGKTVLLLEPGDHLGGLSSGGLSHTDGGDEQVCGGIAREFYNLTGKRNFRPSQAEAAYATLLQDTAVRVQQRAHLTSVQKQGATIVSITMEDGLVVRARQFLDCTYEGDLLARAGVSWHAGREANSVYEETYNGIRTPGQGGHNWPADISPYRVAGDPASGLLPRITADPGRPGDGDERIQAFCFRMWLTKENPQPFPKPDGYDESEYEVLARLFEAGVNPAIQWSLDTNNHHLFRGACFIDYVGGNYDWPNASWQERERIFQEHVRYQLGVMWFLTHSDRIPEPHRTQLRQWGLPRDEYRATGGWTHQLYIREGRRMVSDYVMTEHNCSGRLVPADSVGLASYNMDSHHCQMVDVNGSIRNEGNVEIAVEPYPIAYRALVPKRDECTNLLVPVALSSSHIAFGSIRMEPVFMLLGQSAATAACLAIDDAVTVQDISYPPLRERLLADGQILEYTGPPRHRRGPAPLDPATLPGVVVDNSQAELSGPWVENNVTHPRVGPTYVHDNNESKGKCIARYTAKLPGPDLYEIRVSWPPNQNRATNVPITIIAGRERSRKVVNQKQSGADGFNSLGRWHLADTVTVEISNAETNGYVIADAVQILPADDDPLEKTNRKLAPSPQPGGDSKEQPGAAVLPPRDVGNPLNILILFADDLGYEALGCYGGQDYRTPHLDKLAGQGMRFTSAYTSPVCTPSRMSLYTGEYAARHGYDTVLPVHLGTRRAVDFRTRFRTLAQVLRSGGYQTSVTGKWQLAALEFHPLHCQDAGFDSWCVWQIWKAGAKTTRYWQPCFNHDGVIREDIADRFGPDVLADYVIDRMQTAVNAQQPFFIQHNMLLPHWPIVQMPADQEAAREGSVAAMISTMDGLCGRILAAVDELGVANRTVVIFMGDNGTDVKQSRQTAAGPVSGGKTDLNDAGTHIPLLVRWPGTVPRSSVCSDLVDIVDLFPTLCEITQTPLPPGAAPDGLSFAASLTGTGHSARQWVTAGIAQKLSVFDGEYRVSSGGSNIDARRLPAEEQISAGDQSSVQRLQSVLQTLQSLQALPAVQAF